MKMEYEELCKLIEEVLGRDENFLLLEYHKQHILAEVLATEIMKMEEKRDNPDQQKFIPEPKIRRMIRISRQLQGGEDG